jgi:acetolactate synthase-1/2/3 large subunit
LPAAIGVKLAKPDHQVWALQGDGGMLFNQTEALWPMRRHEAPIITVIFNNRSYNETRNRMWSRGKNQRENKLDLLSHLGNPDVNFAKIAEAYDIKGEVELIPMTSRRRSSGPYRRRATASRTCWTCSWLRRDKART